jgi:hypothetical protein
MVVHNNVEPVCDKVLNHPQETSHGRGAVREVGIAAAWG